MDQISALIAGMQQEESQLMAERDKATDQTIRQTTWVIAAGLLLAFLVVPAASFVTSREMGRRAQAEEDRDRFFSLSRDMICIAGFDGSFKRLNPAWEKTLGFTNEELLAAPYLEFVHPEDRESTAAEAAKLATGAETISFENRYRCKHGSYKWLLWSAAPSIGHELIYAVAHDITERKLAEAALQKSHRELRNRFEAAIRASGQLLYEWDPAMNAVSYGNAEGALGYAEAELAGGLARWIELIHPDDQEKFKTEIERVSQTRDDFHLEYRVRRRDGTYIDVEDRGYFIPGENGGGGHMVGFIADVSERKQAEATVRAQFAELEHIYSTAPVGLALLDCEFRYLRINEQLAAMDGRSPEEHIGRTLREVIPEVAEKVEPLLRRVLETGEPVIGIEVSVTDPQAKQPRVALVSYYPLKAGDGSVRGINSVVLDVTERQLMGKQIATLQKFEAIGQLAGGIAHDFNNVIGVMLGWAEIGMEEAPADSRLHGHFQKICDQAQRAAGLTRQLLAFARRQILEPRNLNLNEVVSDLTSFLRKAIPASIEVRLNLAPDLATVRADPTQMEQVLMNLCLNARDAMAAKAQGQLVVESRNIEIDKEYCRFHIYAKPGRYALLSVSDNGMGMDAATQERIFEPFFTTKEVGKGTGLGLATVYGIVKQHGGFLHVYSEPGKGSTFRAYLPIVHAAPEKSQPADIEPVRGGKETILVAEDHEGGRGMVSEILGKLGYTVLMAANGEEAVRIFQQRREEVALLLFDVVMPKLSGPEAFQRIEAIRPGLPVVFATGYSAEVEILNSLTAENRHLIQKPYSPRALARKVRELLDARSAPK